MNFNKIYEKNRVVLHDKAINTYINVKQDDPKGVIVMRFRIKKGVLLFAAMILIMNLAGCTEQKAVLDKKEGGEYETTYTEQVRVSKQTKRHYERIKTEKGVYEEEFDIKINIDGSAASYKKGEGVYCSKNVSPEKLSESRDGMVLETEDYITQVPGDDTTFVETKTDGDYKYVHVKNTYDHVIKTKQWMFEKKTTYLGEVYEADTWYDMNIDWEEAKLTNSELSLISK